MDKFGLKEEVVQKINAVFAQYIKIDKVIVYGSRAKGNYKIGSDIDLTIVDSELTFSEFLELENKLDDLLLPYKIDLSQLRLIQNPDLVDHISRVGLEFYLRK